MKKFIVTATAPATAKITVSAECREEAIDKAESMIDMGKALDFSVDILDADDVELSAKEADQPTIGDLASDTPALKPYLVTLEATSVKEVPIKAVSAEAAEELVRQMYFNSDVLDFSDEDMERVVATVMSDDDEADEDALIGLLYAIFGDEDKIGKPKLAN